MSVSTKSRYSGHISHDKIINRNRHKYHQTASPQSFERVGGMMNRFGDYFDITGGFAFKSNNFSTSGVPVIRIGDISGFSIALEGVARHSSDKKYEAYSAAEGDILIALSGATAGKVGKFSLSEFGEQAYINQRVGRIRAKNQNSSTQAFGFYIMQLPKFQHFISLEGIGGAQPNVSPSEISSYPITLPPLAEQERIVEILSDADAAINAAETSFATRHKRLRGLIQSLIGVHQTSPKWDAIALDDIGRVSSAGVDKKSVDGETQVTLLNYMDVYRLERIASGDLYHQVTAPNAKVSSCNIQKGDIFFTPTSEKRDDIAHSAVAWEDIQGAVYSYHVVRLRPSISLDINFSSYAFQTNHFMRQAYRLADGSGQRYVISLGGFRGMTIALPPIEQQRAIGVCLAEARSELDKLSSEILALKKQKRGLMQQLLTGKLRVPEK